MKRVFILGNPRSGTSLFRLMLQQHSQIVAPPESGFAHWWYPKYKDWSLENNEDQSSLNQYIEDVLSSKKIETWDLDAAILRAQIEKHKPQNYAELTSLVYLCYKENTSTIKVVADKNNYYINHLEDLPKIWEDAIYIHVIRDGRDVACSYLDIEKLETMSKYKPRLENNIKEIAKEWEDNNQRILSFLSSFSKACITVRFEDLVTQTKNTLDGVCKFLNVPFQESMLHYYKQDNSNLSEPAATLDWKKKTQESPDSSRIGRYKLQLTTKDIDVFNSVANNTLKEFNYFTS